MRSEYRKKFFFTETGRLDGDTVLIYKKRKGSHNERKAVFLKAGNNKCLVLKRQKKLFL